jgi:hypothetical protein
MPSTSRWLVGSSRNRMSWSPMRSFASATRRRWPPESCVDHVADERVARPLVLVDAADDRLADGLAVGQGVALVEHADGDAAAARDAAAVRLQATGEEGEEGRLAVAVASDDADAVALVHPDGHVVEDHARRELEVERFGSQQMGHRTSLGDPRPGNSREGSAVGPHRDPRGPRARRGAARPAARPRDPPTREERP